MSVCGKCHREARDGALFCSFCGESIKPTQSGQTVDPLIGQTVAGKYFIHQLLGRGGMGDVYKATHLTLDRPVVLKLLKKLFHSDASLVQRFHREARAASRLNHPNSITIIDFGQSDDGTLFMAMEYLAGRSLERVIAEEQPLPEPRVVHMGAQILAALAEAHALGIIHRDLKPANVMIEPRRDEPDFVKVLDFGIAKLNEPGDGGGGLTQAGIVCGTPGYMSTEQVRGDELDARSDLYAVGVILYEMLTGVLPFESDTPMGLVTKHLVEDPPPLGVRKPGLVVSPALEAIVMQALSRDRRERFPSADEMRAALLACGSAAVAAPLRPTPPPSSTIIFDSAALPGAPPQRPPTGSVRKPGTPTGSRAELVDAVQARMTAVFEEPASSAPVQKTPAPAVQKTPPPAVKKTPPPPVKKTPPPAAQKTPPPAKPPPKAPPAAVHPQQTQEAAPAGRSKTPIFIGAAVAAVVVVGGAAFFLSGGKSADAQAVTPPPPPPVVVAPPKPPPVVETPKPPPVVDAQPKPPPVVETQPKPPPVVETQPTKPKPEVKTVAHVARSTKGIKTISQELNAIPTPGEASGDGVLTVVATPWAEVEIDGRDVGETPRVIRLGAGSYKVRASHPALGTREQTVTIKAGKRQTWSPTFAN
jgi:serine/threonine-protein kinase